MEDCKLICNLFKLRRELGYKQVILSNFNNIYVADVYLYYVYYVDQRNISFQIHLLFSF